MNYKEILEQHPDKNYSQIADALGIDDDTRDEFIFKLSLVRFGYSGEYKGSGRSGDDFSYQNGVYTFTFSTDNGEHVWDMPKEHIEAAYAWYVSKGGGHTAAEVCEKLWDYYKRSIDENYLSRVFKCLGITKSHSSGPLHIILDATEEEQTEFLTRIFKTKIDAKAKDESSIWRRLYEQSEENRLTEYEFVEKVIDHLEKSEVDFDFPAPNVIKTLPATSEVIFLTDWHGGKAFSESYGDFNADVAKARLKELTEKIITNLLSRPNPLKEVVYALGGDMTDGPLGNMHPDQGIHQDLIRTQQTLFIAQWCSYLIRSVDKVLPDGCARRMHGLGGNHGRVMPDRKEDPGRFGDLSAYYLLAEMIKDLDYNIVFSEKVLELIRVNNSAVVLSHGDRCTTKAHQLYMSMQLYKEYMDMVLLNGHFHGVLIEEEQKGVYHFQGGCLPGTDPFAAEHGKSNTPSQMMFEVCEEEGIQFPRVMKLL